MNRRHFVRAASALVLVPAALESTRLVALAALSPRDSYAFFDERFAEARRIGASWGASHEPIAVQGDITPLWSGGLDRATRERALQLQGVTTDAFRFCLGILLSEHADVDLRVSRLDRNLFLWTMRTTPRIRAEPSDG